MVTGGAGFIGTGIVRQLMNYDVKQIIVLDDSVSHLQDLTAKFPTPVLSRLKLIPGNVKNEQQMRNIFSEYRPWIVFHAAGYQNIAFMENFPFYSLEVNIFGAKIMADLSGEYRVKRFINLSSDVALNPVSIMGASKRIGEMYIQALAQTKKYPTRFASVRFGNLATPSSAALQLLEKQIGHGGPVTIPVKNARFWLTSLEETVRLILQAAFMGNNGKLFSLALGESVTYYDLAVNTIVAYGYEPHKQIEIRITGEPEDEKLYNEPDYPEEILKPTAHPQIREEKRLSIDYATLNRQINKLLGTLDDQNLNELIEQMMYIVPEYISHNKGFSDGGSKSTC